MSTANWQDFARKVAERGIYIKLIHATGGLYIWEVLLNIDYEYSIIMGKRKFTQASSLFITSRWCTLLAVIIQFVALDTRPQIDCQAFVTALFTFITLAYLSASALTILRIFTLWERNRVVITIASIAWLANAASYVHGITTPPRVQTALSCLLQSNQNYRIFMFSTFATDLVLLVLMLCGVLRWVDCDMGGIWWVLFTQGLAYVVIFTLAEVPAVVFISLNLNDIMDQMFMFPAMVVMTVAASRMYLGLVNSSAFHRPPVKVVSTKKQSMETKIYPGALDRCYLGEGSSSTGGTSPHSTHDADALHEGDVV